MNHNKGFTLVELLAVIVILAIILAIAIPSISSIITNTEKSSFVSSTKLLINAVKLKLLEDNTFNITTINKSNLKSVLNIEDENYSYLSLRYDNNGNINVYLVGTGKWANFITYGTYDNINVLEGMVTDSLVLNLDAGIGPSYPGSGTKWYDLSGNGKNGTLINGVGYNSGNLSFDGVNDYVLLPDSSTWTIGTNNFSLGIWFNPSLISGHKRLASSWNGGTSNYGTTQFVLAIDGNGTVFANFGNGSGWYNQTLQTANGLISTNKWFNVYLNIETSNIKIYLNGELKASIVRPGSLPSSTKLEIGGWEWDLPYGGVNRYFKGLISETSIYNRALSEAEIEQNFNAVKGRYGL